MSRSASRSLSRPPSRALPRGILVPVVVGTIALVLAVVLGYVTIRDTSAAQPVAPAGAEKLATDRLVSEVGGFAFSVPRELETTRQGDTIHLVSHSKDLVIVVGPGGRGSLEQAEKRMVARMKREYPKLRLLAVESATVNGNETRTVYGQAVNRGGTRLRLALVTIHGARKNFTVASYTAYGADPTAVLPQVNTVVNTFEVLAPAR